MKLGDRLLLLHQKTRNVRLASGTDMLNKKGITRQQKRTRVTGQPWEMCKCGDGSYPDVLCRELEVRRNQDEKVARRVNKRDRVRGVMLMLI